MFPISRLRLGHLKKAVMQVPPGPLQQPIVGFEYDSGLDRYYYYVSAGAPAVTLSFETKDYRLTTQAVNTFMEAAGAVTNGTHIYVTGAWSCE
jgi:hypothetical protein